ncbi:MAG: hypothetical protein ACFBSF_09485 [Leptolyngbyaceae cyanobacterium]
MGVSPYRSNVLRWVMGHAQQIRSQAAKTWRWAKLRAFWGLQGTIAIAHGAWHWSWCQWRQLAARTRDRLGGISSDETPQVFASVAQRPVDTPICQILSTLEAALSAPGACKGIATDLATRRLAWVATDAIVVVNEETHASLQSQMTLVLAEYDHQSQLASQQAPLVRPLEPMHGARILAWIWQAIAYFFGAGFSCRRHAWTKPVSLKSQSESVSLAGRSTFVLTLLPGIWSLGSIVAAWIRRTLVRWFTGAQLPPSLQENALQKVPEPAIASSRGTSNGPNFQDKIVSLQAINSYASIATATVTPSIGTAETWLEVPATVVGYERSLLVQLLTLLDWVLVRLEQLLAKVWQYVRTLLALR